MRAPAQPQRAAAPAIWVNLAVLLAIGAGWGVTLPLTKLVVSAGYRHFGLIFWQVTLAAVILAGALGVMGRLHRPSGAQLRMAALIALCGTLLPNTASYQAMAHLPSGVVSILLSSIPMLAFPLAIALGTDRFHPGKLLGLCLGLLSVCLIVAMSGSFEGNVSMIWVLIALIAPAFYALEGNLVAKWGTFGLDAVQLLFWASVLAIPPAAVLALVSGQFISPLRAYGAAEYAFVLISLLHAVVYSSYIWLARRAGAVFAAQVSYLVTLFGILWAMALLGERYGAGIWAALALMCVGLFLVQRAARRSAT